MNTYRTQFTATCPADGQRIVYSLEMETNETVMVEAINDALDEITEDYQESIAQRLHESFPQCAIRLQGVHQGVEIVCTLARSSEGGSND